MRHETIFSFSITDKDSETRIDSFLSDRFRDLTRTRIQKLIKDGYINVNNRISEKASYRLKNGDFLTLTIPPASPSHLEPESIELSLVHEDPYLIVLNKPAGIVMHPGPGHTKGTLVHGLLNHCKDLSGIGGVLRPGIVHRLDKDTSGLIVIAKNDNVHTFLSDQFKARKVKKRYLTLIHGIPDNEKGEIDLPIGRNPQKRKERAVLPGSGKRAITRWRKKEEFAGRFSLLSVTLKTGRTHQIRVHLSHIGYPIVGDGTYGFKKKWWAMNFPQGISVFGAIKRQMLHAEKLGFIHPVSKEYCVFKAPIPEDMSLLIKKLRDFQI